MTKSRAGGRGCVVKHRRKGLPPWVGAYAAFRFGDGLTSSLVPLAIVIHYQLPLWGLALVVATMNLAGVPAAFLWGKRMEKARRRRVVVTGFALSGLGMLVMATLPPVPIFVAGAVLFTAFGVSTGPAASTMILQRVPRAKWGKVTGALSRVTGFAYLAGMVTSITLTLNPTWFAGFGLGSGPHFDGQFAAATVMALGAAGIALAWVPPWNPPLPHEAGFDARLAQETVRRFERPVYFPGRLRNAPSFAGLREAAAGPVRLWLAGYTLTFMGSVCFFASYPGVLSSEWLLPAGLVLLAQAPSHLVTPLTYTWAGRLGAKWGEARMVMVGGLLRTAALPLLCVLLLAGGKAALPEILVLHALMGLSFAFLSVNGPVILAELHPGGRGPGVGAYHAAVGLGTLLGALSAYVILLVAGLGASYLFSIAMATLGFAMLVRAWRRSAGTLAPQGPSASPKVDLP